MQFLSLSKKKYYKQNNASDFHVYVLVKHKLSFTRTFGSFTTYDYSKYIYISNNYL